MCFGAGWRPRGDPARTWPPASPKKRLGCFGKKKKLSWVFGISAGSPGGDLCFSGCPWHGAGCPEGFLVSGRRCRVLLPWGCRRWRNAPSPGAAWLSYLPSLGSHSRRPRRLRRTTRGRWQWRDDPAESDISWEAGEEKSVGSSRVRRAPPNPSALPIPVRGLRGRNRSAPEPPCGSWVSQKAPGHGVKIWGETPCFAHPFPKAGWCWSGWSGARPTLVGAAGVKFGW